MSRFEGDFSAAGDAPLSKVQLRDLLGRERHAAIACYLSSGEGWDKALEALGGAFASDAAKAARSNGIKQDKHEINQRASEYLQSRPLKTGGTDND